MKTDTILTFPGQRYRATHRASVVSILGERAPVVRSYGSQFFNRDRWTLRFLIQELCTWAKKNPDKVLNAESLQLLVEKANRVPVPQQEIVIAATPDELSPGVAMALVGGAYHEAWHTLYSYRGTLRHDPMQGIILPRWEKLKSWANLTALLLEWSNVIEDIRIERRGNEQFGGTLPRMHDLQDFILNQERPLRESSAWTPLSTLLAVFRDAGLGYATDTAQSVFSFYKRTHPDIFDLVVRGKLRPALDEAIAMPETDSVGCLRLAMDVALILDGLALVSKPEAAEESCPRCGAPPSDRRTRPNLKTLAPMTLCLQCGHMETSPFNAKGTRKGEESKGEESKGEERNASHEGGDAEASTQWSPETLSQVILTLLSQGESAGLQDFSSAMESLQVEQENDRKLSLQRGEQPWTPFTLDQDEVLLVPPGPHAVAQDLLAETRAITSFLQTRLRTILLALRVSETEHGHKRGVHLSARNLTTTHVSLRGGDYPNRAFTRHREGLEESFAGAIILDQSGSMCGQQGWMTRCLFALAIPLDLLGFPLLIAGFQTGRPIAVKPTSSDEKQYHRLGAVRFNVFKEFNCPFRSSMDRATNINASGGTPMADGIQFGLQALRNRPETHRALFVITDGEPDGKHTPVINWQTRIAKESGIPIIGVGVGKFATHVCSLFEDHIWAPDFSAIPNALVTKLSMLINPFDRRHQKPLRLGTQTWDNLR